MRRHGVSPCRRHVSAMQAPYKKKIILSLRKNLHMKGACKRHEPAMGAPCHARVPWRKNVFLVTLKKLFHTKRHGNAMSRRAPWKFKCFLSNLDKKFQMEGAMDAPCERLVSNAGGKILHGAPPCPFFGQTLDTKLDMVGCHRRRLPPRKLFFVG